MLTLSDILQPGLTAKVGPLKDGCVVETLPDAAVKSWLAACHAGVRMARGRVGVLRPPTCGRNFHTLGVEIPGVGPIHLVLHCVLPFVGALRNAELSDHEEYLDAPIREEGGAFRVVPKSLLDTPLTIEGWMKDIDSAILYDIKYWRPRRVGDLVFNYYD